jgi:hypothetical protein
MHTLIKYHNGPKSGMNNIIMLINNLYLMSKFELNHKLNKQKNANSVMKIYEIIIIIIIYIIILFNYYIGTSCEAPSLRLRRRLS